MDKTLFVSWRNMYFIKYHPLKEDLRKRQISDRHALPYLIVFIALTTLSAEFPIVYDIHPWHNLSGFLSVGISVWGVYYAYIKNGGSEGYDLIQKFVVLGWVLNIRIIIIMIPTVFLFDIINDWLDVFKDTTNLYEAYFILLEIVFYKKLGLHISDTNNNIS